MEITAMNMQVLDANRDASGGYRVVAWDQRGWSTMGFTLA